MNMPIDKEGRVSFTTTLFALIRDNLKINVRESAEMDQADLELRATIMKVWPVTRAGKIDLLVPTEDTTGAGDFGAKAERERFLIFILLGKLTVGKLYGGVLIYEIWKTTRFSNLEILAKMEEEMEEKEALARGETLPKKEDACKEGTASGTGAATPATIEVDEKPVEEPVVAGSEDVKMSDEKSYNQLEAGCRSAEAQGWQQAADPRSQWEDWAGWNPPCEDWARSPARPDYRDGRPHAGSLEVPDGRQTRFAPTGEELGNGTRYMT
jgi:hypothetical protein